MKLFSIYFILSILIISCNNDVTPKPNAYLNHKYPTAIYQKTNIKAPYSFEYSHQSIFNIQKNWWAKIHYPNQKADITITYQEVNNNITKLITDAEKLTYKHAVKADNIEMFPYENEEQKIYAKLFEITGNAASCIQFQATDSTKHFLSGTLYFDVSPNYDSITPAIKYIKEDIQHLIETIEWYN